MSEVQQTTPAVVVPPATSAAPVAATPTVVPPVQPATPGQPAASTAPEPKGAPETYTEFKAPEGMQANKALVDSFVPIAKELGLTQEAAQRLVTFQMEAMKNEIASYDAKIEAEFAGRNAATAKDPFLGSPDTIAKVANAQRAMAAFGDDPDLKAFIDSKETSTKEYLAVMRFAAKVGAAIKEDSTAGTQGAASGEGGGDFATEFYRKAQKPNEKKTAA